jgi:hypothetical protein
MSKRPVFWIFLVLLSGLSLFFAIANFSKVMQIVSLDLKMDRRAALGAARSLAEQHHWCPTGAYKQAASFSVDDTVKTFVELEGGGKEAFGRMLDRGLYAAYTWRVRHFREGEANETTVRFTPEGKPYGFIEKLPKDAPGPSLSEAEARTLAEDQAGRVWQVDLSQFLSAETSKEIQPSGRTDYTFVYERPSERQGEGRYRLRLVVGGDRLTQLTHFLKVPEAFTRRYEEMRSANNAISLVAMALAFVLYLIGGGGFGLFKLLRRRWVIWRTPLILAGIIALIEALGTINSWPIDWMRYDTALSGSTFMLNRILQVLLMFLVEVFLLSLSLIAAESLTRRAFPDHPQLWRIWSRDAAGTVQVLGRTIGGFLYACIEMAYVVGFYLIAVRFFHWWTPAESLVDPDILAHYLPWLSAVAPSLHAGVWEEAMFRAIPIAGAALIGSRWGHRRWWIGGALVLQAVIFGGGHASYPSEPAYSRLVELILPAFAWGIVYLCFGLLPVIIMHYVFDLALFSIPLFTSTSAGARVDQVMIVLCGLLPLIIVLAARLRAPAWGTLGESLLNRAWAPAAPESAAKPPAVSPPLASTTVSGPRVRWVLGLGIAGLLVWGFVGLHADAPRFRIGRGEARARGVQALSESGFQRSDRWKTFTTVEARIGARSQFVWRTAGHDVYRSLLGTYVMPTSWAVREASFAGDVAERAEEWEAWLAGDGSLIRVRHQLPQARPGSSLDEGPARAIAGQAVRERLHMEPSALKEISAVSAKLPARRDWTFTFADTVNHALKRGELRLAVEIAGDQVVDAHRFVFIPEEWERSFQSEESLLGALGVVRGGLLALVLITAGIVAIILWSRGIFSLRVGGWTFAVLAVVFLIGIANRWPAMEARFSTAQPLPLQQVMVLFSSGLVQLVMAALFGLLGGLGASRASTEAPVRPKAPLALGVALGLMAAGVVRLLWLWSRTSKPAGLDFSGADMALPVLKDALSPIAALLIRSVILLVLVRGAAWFSKGWTVRRAATVLLLFLFGATAGHLGSGGTTALWFGQALVSGLVLVAIYALALRHDLSLAPVAVGTLLALGQLRAAIWGAYPGATAGALLGFVAVIAVTVLSVRMLRGQAPISDPRSSPGRECFR